MIKLIRVIPCLIFAGVLHSVQAQLASFDFNSDVTDQVGNNDPTTIGTPVFTDGAYVTLGPEDYLVFPMELSQALDNTSSIEIDIRFRVRGDASPPSGEILRPILSSKNRYDQRVGGFDVAAREWEGTLQIITTFGDGINYGPGLPPSEGKLDFVAAIETDTWYDFKLKFILDTDVPYIQYVINNTVIISYYDDRMDPEGFIETLNAQQIAVGSDLVNQYLEFGNPTLDLDVDYLTFYSPVPAGDPNQVRMALEALTSHFAGETTLTDEEVDSWYSVFVDHWDDGTYESNEEIVLSYINTHGSQSGVIFDQPYKEKLPDLTPGEGIRFILQQWLLDNQYEPTHVTDMEGVVFVDHERYPGVVSPTAPRLQDATFKIDGDYQTDPGFYLNGQEFAIRPTGYYVAPGELVTITVPGSAIGQGLTLYVGAHNVDLQETWTEFTRFPRISTNYELDETTLIVTNPFGGGIYVTVPDGSALGPLEFSLSGAVKAPYYCTKPGFTTDLQEFMNAVEARQVPWVDIESSNAMMTISVGKASTMSDPDKVLDIWDRMFDAFNTMLGRPLERFRGEYMIQDINGHVKYTAAPAAYPMSLETLVLPYDPDTTIPVNVENGDAWFKATLADHFIISHEFGHLHNMPTILYEQETNVNVPAAAAYSMVMGESVDSAFVYSIQQRLNLDQAALDWILTANFYEGRRMGYDTITNEKTGYQQQYQSRGHARYVDIANMFDWEALGNILGYFYNYKRDNPEWDPYGLQDDELIRIASTQMGFNMAPHFEFWGIVPSDELVTELASMETSGVIKERIIHYRNLVPKNNAEFQPIYNVMTSKLESQHQIRYESMKTTYDEATANEIILRIDTILYRYYELDETDFNIDPVITGLVSPLSTFVDTPITLSLTDFVVEDPDNDFPSDFTLTVYDGDNYTVSGLTVTPDMGFVGALSVPVTVNDGLEDSEQYTASIEVKVPNEIPVITGVVAPLSTNEHTPITLALTDFVVEDPDNDFPTDFTLTVYGGDHYTVTENEVTPDAGFVGEISVPVTVKDGQEESDLYLAIIAVVQAVLGITDPAVQTNFWVYPNPVSSLLVLETDRTETGRPYEVAIFSLQGDEIFFRNKSIESKQFLDLTNMKEGLYILRIKIGKRESSVRIIKQ